MKYKLKSNLSLLLFFGNTHDLLVFVSLPVCVYFYQLDGGSANYLTNHISYEIHEVCLGNSRAGLLETHCCTSVLLQDASLSPRSLLHPDSLRTPSISPQLDKIALPQPPVLLSFHYHSLAGSQTLQTAALLNC